MSGLDVSFDFWDTFASDPIPQDLACPLVESIHVPGMRRSILVRIHVTEQTVAKIVAAFAADCSSNEYAISPNHRARMSETWNRCFPKHVCALGSVPGSRRGFAVADPRRVRPAKRRPILRSSIQADPNDENENQHRAKETSLIFP